MHKASANNCHYIFLLRLCTACTFRARAHNARPSRRLYADDDNAWNLPSSEDRQRYMVQMLAVKSPETCVLWYSGFRRALRSELSLVRRTANGNLFSFSFLYSVCSLRYIRCKNISVELWWNPALNIFGLKQFSRSHIIE